MLVGDFLGAVLVDRMVVAGDQRLVVTKPDLLLAHVAFAFDRLESQTRTGHTQPDVAQQRLHPRGCQYRVVDVVVAGRGQPAIPAGPCLAIRLVEHDELQLGGHIGDQSARLEPIELTAQNAARRDGDLAAVGPDQVGDHQRRSR